jgi:hypothetical protein
MARRKLRRWVEHGQPVWTVKDRQAIEKLSQGPILSFQWTRPERASPEQRLLLSLIETCVLSFLRGLHDDKYRNSADWRQDRAWLLERCNTHFGSRENICAQLIATGMRIPTGADIRLWAKQTLGDEKKKAARGRRAA